MNAAATPFRVETGFWLVLWLGLAIGIGYEIDWGRKMQWPITKIAEAPPALAKSALTEPYRLPPPEEFLEITLRPIFVATRRPAPAAPAGDQTKSSMKKDQFILTGTTITGQDKFAFLIEKAGNRSRVVAEGKEINGIMVKEVTAERVVLKQDDDTEVLILRMIQLPPGAARNALMPGIPGDPASAERMPGMNVPQGPNGMGVTVVPPPPAVTIPDKTPAVRRHAFPQPAAPTDNAAKPQASQPYPSPQK